MYWNVCHSRESYFLQNFSLLVVIIFSWTPFFGGFNVILVWSVNYYYISNNWHLKDLINKEIKAYILNQISSKFQAFSTMRTIVTKTCLTKMKNEVKKKMIDMNKNRAWWWIMIIKINKQITNMKSIIKT